MVLIAVSYYFAVVCVFVVVCVVVVICVVVVGGGIVRGRNWEVGSKTFVKHRLWPFEFL